MNWFGGTLIVKIGANHGTKVYRNVTLHEAQRILDEDIRPGFVADALYEPYPTSMGQQAHPRWVNPHEVKA